MYILGINTGEICSAAIMKDGQVIAACIEERFKRVKSYSGFPKYSIDYCLSTAGISPEELDLVAVADLAQGAMGIIYSYVQRRSSFTVSDYIKEAHEYWYPKLYLGKEVNYLDIFKDKICLETFPEKFNAYFFKELEKFNGASLDELQYMRKRLIQAYLPAVSEDKIKFYPHHEIHAFYGYFASKFAKNQDPALIITADSWGDFENAMISKMAQGNFEVLHVVNNQNLGWLYRNMTLYLGMKPYEHEYKVMGLAPYAPQYLLEAAFNVFAQTLEVNDVNFFYKVTPEDNYFWFKERLEGIRFDGVAAGLQHYFEDRMQRWISNALMKYKTRNMVFSGGLAMNIKLNMKLAQMGSVDDFFVPASPDDNTNCIGVCFLALYKHIKSQNKDPLERIRPLETMYLGSDVGDKEIYDVITKNNLNLNCSIIDNAKPDFVAKKLTNGIIIGRCAGRMEFGARALGNRSILADPRNLSTVERINRIIKKRDFWMPFAPVIIDTYWDKYIDNRNKVFSPFMTVGFPTSESGRQAMPAAIHPADKTIRPQMLVKEMNPYYYNIVQEFEKLTGVGALINTSFNLHEHPIVKSPEDAVWVFLKSDLDALLLNNVYIEKKRA